MYYKVSMNVYSSYKQIFNQNEGLHGRGNNEKIMWYKIATLEGVIATLEGVITTLEGVIATLEGVIATLEGVIATLEGLVIK